MPPHATSARAALERQREGNRRFAADLRSLEGLASRTRRADLVAGQRPFAIILGCIVSRVRPSVEALLATDLRNDPEALVREAVKANVRASVDHLRHESEILEELAASSGLRIVGAEYSLETGVVEFHDDVMASL